MSASSTAELTVEGLTIRFGGLTAVDNVSFEVRAGEVLSLIGPNGAGKTSLFNVVSGLYRPSGGRVLLGGADVTRLAPYRRARLGLGRTFQTSAVFASLSVMVTARIVANRA